MQSCAFKTLVLVIQHGFQRAFPLNFTLLHKAGSMVSVMAFPHEPRCHLSLTDSVRLPLERRRPTACMLEIRFCSRRKPAAGIFHRSWLPFRRSLLILFTVAIAGSRNRDTAARKRADKLGFIFLCERPYLAGEERRPPEASITNTFLHPIHCCWAMR